MTSFLKLAAMMTTVFWSKLLNLIPRVNISLTTRRYESPVISKRNLKNSLMESGVSNTISSPGYDYNYSDNSDLEEDDGGDIDLEEYQNLQKDLKYLHIESFVI
jgi:hypothetical protein